MTDMINPMEEIDGLQELVATASENGYVTFTQILEAMPAVEHNIELLDQIVEEVQENGIAFVEKPEDYTNVEDEET